MLQQSRAELVVSDEDLIDQLPAGRRLMVAIDDRATAAAVGRQPDTDLGLAVGPEALAYVMFTSGSTGRPKGVQVTHGGVVNLVAAQAPVFGVAEGTGALQFASFGFDAWVSEVGVALVSGAELVVVSSAERAESGVLAGLIRDRGVEVATLPPSLLAILAPGDLDGLVTLVSAGERLSSNLATAWAAHHRVVNAYGPTEVTVCATAAVYDPAVEGEPAIGGPISNAGVYVLDRALNPVPVGVAGELYIGGAGLARGYVGRPDLTGERFVADPVAGDGSRLYRSGDLVRWRADGQLEFLGRADQQVKVRGYRIEPAEIETVLRRHPRVADAVVAADGQGADRRLAAYVVLDDQAVGIPVGELRAMVSAVLPDYMIPALFVELTNLPLTPSGKVDRAALPAPDHARPELADEFVAPRTATEQLLAGIWCEVLDLDRVGVHDDFFVLGGHSLLATRVVSRVQAVFKVEMLLVDLFDRPTVAELAEVIDRAATGVVARPMVPVDRDRPLPLSYAQQRLWFLAQLEPDSVQYNAALTMLWQGPLDVDGLAEAVGRLVARHEVLRTRLVTDADGTPYQAIDPAPDRLAVSVADVSGEADPAEALDRLVAVEERVPFDLATGPLLRVSVVRLSDSAHVVVLAMHHVVADGWSAEIIRRELPALYAGADLPDLPVQYADFAVWQRDWLSGAVLDRQLTYWRNLLTGAPVLDLPLDRPRPPVPSDQGAIIEFAVPPAVVDGLRRASRAAGASMFMTLLGGFAALLSRYSGQDDVIVRTPVANRNRTETEGVVGLFVNAMALRIDLSGDPTFGELLERVRERALGAQAHQDLPFEQLVDALGVERDRSRSPLGQVTFNYFADGAAEAAGEFEASGARASVAKEDLRLIVVESSTGLMGAVEYRTALFDEDRMARLTGHLVELFTAVAADVDVPMSQVDVLPQTERSRMVREWNQTGAALPVVGGAHELFEARVAAGPDRCAVTCGAESLSYGELNARANRLARYLAARGVGAETVVGVCLPRGIDVVVAVLAVWKAGGAYVPLDPEYPVERLGFMVQQSGASLVVSAGELLPATVVLDDPETVAAMGELPDTDLGVQVAPDGLAYVMFTSGSTGRPKGVQVTHGGVVNLIAAQTPVFEVAEGTGALQFASFGFDAWVSEVGVALASGAELVVASSAERASVAALIRDRGVQVATLPPSLLAVLTPGDLDGLVTLVSAGERLPADLAVAWGARHRLVNAYGPTETTVCATAGVYDCGEPSIGGPIGNVAVYVLDRSLMPVPVGVAGELYIGGAGVARGYVGRPELTAERFVADPFGGSRLYRSGDRVRWRGDGRLEFLGRADNQVKVRGHRIEPAEIETVLRGHPRVTDAVVIADGHGADRRLAAYVVLGDQAVGIPVGELQAMVSAALPDYMVPAVFVELQSLPLTPSRKVDRAALPSPDHARPDLTAEFTPPGTPTEEILAGIWCEVLGVDRVGIHDDFFLLGGHSLLATRVVSRLKITFGVELALPVLFDQPTVAGLAEVLEAELYREIEQMSEDEALRSLGESAPGTGDDEDGLQ